VREDAVFQTDQETRPETRAPFAECNVISVTVLASGSFSSRSVTSEIASKERLHARQAVGSARRALAASPAADATDRREPVKVAAFHLLVEQTRKNRPTPAGSRSGPCDFDRAFPLRARRG